MRGEILDGRYELVERLGRGGMGQVWAARDTRMHREAAVKLVTALPRIGEQKTFLRFRREIRSAAQLPGRYTVIAHDCGEAVPDDERVLYMVRERLTGRTLYDEVVQQRPSWRRAVAWARQAATDFGTNLAKRREQSERDLAARQHKAEKRLTEIEGRAEQLRLEAEAMVTGATEKAGRILSNDAVSELRDKMAAIIADSRFTPVGGLVEQRALTLRELTGLHDALSRFDDLEGGWERVGG